jgi:hypothetical protein
MSVSPASPGTKPHDVEDTPEEELLYRTLAAHSDDTHTKFTHEQVRLIKRMFDRVDTAGKGEVGTHELQDMLLRVGDDTAHRVLKDLIASGAERLSFPDFVRTFQKRLTVDEACRMMDVEVTYIQSMGIDTKQLEQMEHFRATKGERRNSQHMSSNSLLGSGDHSRDNSQRPSVSGEKADILTEYRREFGLPDEEETKEK